MDKSKNEETVDEGLLNKLAAGTALGLSLATGTPDAEAKSKDISSQSISQPLINQKIQAFNNIFAKQKNKLINALIQVESRGNNNAVGDHGDAVGPLQIHAEVVKDFNRWTNLDLKHIATEDDKKAGKKDMFDRPTAIMVCDKYLSVYGKEYIKKTGEIPTMKILAQIWNGGPNGWKNPNTDHYAAKVLKSL